MSAYQIIDADRSRFLETDKLVWFDPADSTADDVQVEWCYAADDGASTHGPYPAIYGSREMELSIPGGALVPAAGLTWVGVHPDHRRRGLLTAMLRHHFDSLHQRGIALSVLHASEPRIYGRHGYGEAARTYRLNLPAGLELSAPALEEAASATTVRMHDITDDDIPTTMAAIDRLTAPSTIGTCVFRDGFYRRASQPSPGEIRREHEVRRVLIAERDGQLTGSVRFVRKESWDAGRSTSTAEASHLVGDPATRLALVRRLTQLDLIVNTMLWVGGDDLTIDWAGGARQLGQVGVMDAQWVRLIDLPAALEQRAYEADAQVVVQVSDQSAPWNEGRWSLDIANGSAQVSRTDKAADLSLDVSALGSTYLGQGSLEQLLRAGRVTEHRLGATRELSAALHTQVPPTRARDF